MLILLRKKHGALRGVPAGWVACNEVQAQGGAPPSFSIEYEKLCILMEKFTFWLYC